MSIAFSLSVQFKSNNYREMVTCHAVGDPERSPVPGGSIISIFVKS